MINKIVDEYRKIKEIIKKESFCLIDTKPATVVIRTKDNDYLRFYEVILLNFEYYDNTVYIYDVNNGYSQEIKNKIIEKITIL